MKTIKLTITAVIFTLSLNSFAQAEKTPEQKAENQAKWLLNKFDTDKDQQLSKNEATPKYLSKWFSFIDKDKNEVLSFEELKANRLKNLLKNKGKGGANKKAKVAKAKKSIKKAVDFNYSKLSYKELFKKLDADKNKKLVKSEFATSSSLSADFNKIDKNGNGKVTRRELKKYLAKKK